MGRKLRWKLTAIGVVLVLFGAFGIYPLVAARLGVKSPRWLIDRQLALGLDLKGGVQLVVRVDTDYAVRLESQQRTLSKEAEAEVRRDAVARTIETIERRIDALGVAEPGIARQGTAGDEILIQLPGLAEVDRAKAIIQAGGTLEFRLVEQGPTHSAAELTPGGRSAEVLPEDWRRSGESPGQRYYLVDTLAAATGRELRTARPSLDENNQPAVSFMLTAEGGRKFGDVTAANVGRLLAIVLDGRVRSVARIDSRITTDGMIHGSFTSQEAQDLALILRSGALPAPLSFLAEGSISASLGADSIRQGVVASIVGLLLVVGFMLIYYRASGINATVALVLNLVILLGLMAYVGVVMTLPGIAGFVLTMGIGVDSNVLVFERIREEREAGKAERAAMNAGFSRVFLTLLDTHIAALISAAFLFQFGTGPIRGFAVTLSIGLLSNLFTSTFVSKTLFELALRLRSTRPHQAADQGDHRGHQGV
jgi:preprotein translocase subunit SecD